MAARIKTTIVNTRSRAKRDPEEAKLAAVPAATSVGQVKSLAKGLRALDLLLERAELGTNDLAQALRVDKAGASRILHTLADFGFAVQGNDRRYKPGTKLRVPTTLADVAARASIRERARPLLLRLFEATRETAHLGIRADDQVLYLDKCDTDLPLRVDRPVGTLAPLHCTALGKVLIAYGCAHPAKDLARFTRSTAVSVAQLQSALTRVLAVGYATDDEEFAPGIRCVAAPLYDPSGIAVAALGLSGPAARVASARLPELGRLVTAIARDFAD